MKIENFFEFGRSLYEKVVMPEIFNVFMDELIDLCTRGPISIKTANKIGNRYNINFLTYPEFILSIPEDLRHTAPPRGTPLFGYIGEDNNINIVVGITNIGIRDLGFVHHMIQHESVHVGQWKRRSNSNLKWNLPDPKDTVSYFSNKDEIMAFSQSIVEMIITQNLSGKRVTVDLITSELKNNHLWNSIKKSGVSEEVKKRYMKYIYEYAKNYLDNN